MMMRADGTRRAGDDVVEAWRRHEDMVRAVAHSRWPHDPDAVIGHTLEVLVKHFARLDERRVGAYLRSVACNEAARLYHESRRQLLVLDADGSDGGTWADTLPDPGDPYAHVTEDCDERVLTIREALEACTPRQRAMLLAFHELDGGHGDRGRYGILMRQFDASYSCVNRTLVHARKRLRDRLETLGALA